MKPELKFVLQGGLFCVIGIAFMVWGLSDLVSLFNAPEILIFIIPTIIAVVFIILLVFLAIRNKKKNYFFNEKAFYNCVECSSAIKLEEKTCSRCGVENIKRLEAIKQLEELEMINENEQSKFLEIKLSTKRKKQFDRKLETRSLELLENRLTKIRLRKMRLIIGSTIEDKINWAKTQYHEGNKSIQDIAEVLGEDMANIRRYIDSN